MPTKRRQVLHVYIYVYIYVYTYMYGVVSRVDSPPHPPPWYGPLAANPRLSQILKSVNRHRDGGCRGRDPRNCPRFLRSGRRHFRNCRRFLMSKISKVPTLTRIAGVMVTILVAVTVFPVADVKRSQKCQQSQGWRVS